MAVWGSGAGLEWGGIGDMDQMVGIELGEGLGLIIWELRLREGAGLGWEVITTKRLSLRFMGTPRGGMVIVAMWEGQRGYRTMILVGSRGNIDADTVPGGPRLAADTVGMMLWGLEVAIDAVTVAAVALGAQRSLVVVKTLVSGVVSSALLVGMRG